MLSALDLALAGTVEQYYELYHELREAYLAGAKTSKYDMTTYESFDLAIAHEKMESFQKLAVAQLGLFTDELHEIHLDISDFKRYSMFDQSAIFDFLTEKHIYEKTAPDSPYYLKKYNSANIAYFFFQDCFIEFELFPEVFQKIVTREIYNRKKDRQANCDYLAVRKEVLAHIKAKMKPQEQKLHPKSFERLTVNSEPLSLFDALASTKCSRESHEIITKPYNCLVEFNHKSKVIALPAHYCMQCGRYMMGKFSYSLFTKYIWGIKIPADNDEIEDDADWQFLAESKLHSLGYTVEHGKLSIYERQRLLVYLIESRQITFFEVVSTIENDLRRFKQHPGFESAVEKWKDDLKFINEWERERVTESTPYN